MNILIIGHKGYIGSRLCEFLKEKELNVTGCDIEEDGQHFANLTIEYLSTFNVVILLAANSSVKSCKNNFESLNNNVIFVIELVKKLNPQQKFIYMSSSSVYGTCNDKLVDRCV